MPDPANTADRLIIVLGDQLNERLSALSDLDGRRDLVWMAEAREEATHVPSHKARTALFLSAMRHFRDRLQADGVPLLYRELEDHRHQRLDTLLGDDLGRMRPRRVVMTRAGDYRVQRAITERVRQVGIELEIRDDDLFLCSLADFDRWLRGRKQPRLEHFYRFMRRRSGILMDGDKPLGGRWNFDTENRKSFGRQGPEGLSAPVGFEPDDTTREVMRLVNDRYGDHPGATDDFSWPVTREQAGEALEDFIEHRLARFGEYQDAMWQDEPWLHHSLLSACLNLKLLTPREVIAAAERALAEERAPLAAVEGFVRQILGWREFVRGLYWTHMPEYAQVDELGADRPLPDFYWTGKTEMVCLQSAIGQTLRYGYAHHIQRLMVTGLFALLLGVAPREVHAWYLAVYVDAVEWVELPNTIGMSQYADGGLMGSKPYAASGRYIQRMSNYCRTCRFDPAKSTGEDACPFTTLYWDFLMRHEQRFAQHPRTALQWRNLKRLSAKQRTAIRRQASALRRGLEGQAAGSTRAEAGS